MKPGVLTDNGIDYNASPDTASPGEIVVHIERLKGNDMHVRACLPIGPATFFGDFDVVVIVATLPLLIAQWHLTPARIAFVIDAPGIGQLIGALVSPMLTEYFGCVHMIGYSADIVGLMSLLYGVAPSFVVFVALHIVQGIGLGGGLLVTAMYINEITHTRSRGRFALLCEVVFPIGLLVSNAFGVRFVLHFGWEVMYFLGSIPLVLFFTLSKVAPESSC